MFLLYFFATLAIAREVDPAGPGPVRPPSCNRAKVESCISEHKSAADILLEKISELSKKQNALAKNHSQLETSALDFEKRILLLSENNKLAERERKYLEQQIKNTEKKQEFSSLIPLENIFQLTFAQNNWLENFPVERLSRLNNRADKFAEESTQIQSTHREIRMRIQSLGAELSANQASLHAWENERIAHARMCDYGCEEAHCRSD
jgi:hypothetical protein